MEALTFLGGLGIVFSVGMMSIVLVLVIIAILKGL